MCSCECVFESLLLSIGNLYLFLVTEVPGGDGPGPVLHNIFLSWRTPQANVRTFHPMAGRWVLTFDWDLHPAHVAPLCWEEGLRSIEGQTVDHPSYQQCGGRTAWQDDGYYTASVRRWSPIPIILRLPLEPLAIQTLLVVVAIVTKKDLFDDAHKMQDISWHWMFVCFFLIFVSFNAVSFVNMKWHAQVAFNVQS